MAPKPSPPVGDRPVGGRQPLPTSSRRQQVVDLVRDEIIVGRLAPGDQLKQEDLCRDFGLSPTPVREALRQLESEGLVQHFPNRGVFVSDITSDDLLGLLLPVRLAIETCAAIRVADRADQQAFAALEDLVAQMHASAADGDLAKVNELDLAFHETVVLACGSVAAMQLWRSVQPRIAVLIYRLSPRHQNIHEIPREHRELLDAIRTGGESAIRKIMDEHIIGTAKDLMTAPAAAPRRGRN